MGRTIRVMHWKLLTQMTVAVLAAFQRCDSHGVPRCPEIGEAWKKCRGSYPGGEGGLHCRRGW